MSWLTKWLVGSKILHRSEHEALGVVRNRGSEFVFIGDSKTAAMHQTVSVSALTRSGSTVTATATSHGMTTGQRIRVCNAMPDDFNGYVTITRIDANSFSYSLAGTAGAATLSGHSSGGTFEVRVHDWGDWGHWWQWVNGSFGGGLNCLRNMGVGGWTATYMAANTSKYDAELATLTRQPTDIVVHAGINDILAGRTYAQIIADLATLYAWALSKNARLWVVTDPPLLSGYSGAATKNALTARIRRWQMRWVATTPKAYLIDLYKATVDSTTGHGLANTCVADNIHPSLYGARLGAAVAYTAMNGVVTPVDIRALGNLDNVTGDSGSINVCDYGPWTSSTSPTATTSGSWTGTLAGGLEFSHSGTTAAAAVAVRSDALSYEASATFTSDGTNGRTCSVGRIGDHARFTAGDEVIAIFDVTLTNAQTANNVRGLYAYFRQTVGGTQYFAYSQRVADTVALAGALTDSLSTTLVTMPFKWDGSASACKAAAVMTCSGSDSGTHPVLKVSRITILRNPWATP